MSPDDVAIVDATWAELERCRDTLVDRLAALFVSVQPASDARQRAGWLVDAVSELVGLLAAPSKLGVHARRLAATWPPTTSAPNVRLDGAAWISAAGAACPAWTPRCEQAWRQAWLLLAEVLAEESLAPFDD